MTVQETPAAPVVDETQPPAAVSDAPVGGDDAAAAAQVETQADPAELKRLRDRLAEQGRKNAASEQLALQQAQAIQTLSQQVGQLSQYATQQQQADLRNRMANMSAEEKIDFLTERAMMPAAPPPPVATPQPQQSAQDIAKQQAIAAHLEDINTTLGLDANPLTPDEVGFHANEAAWLRAAWKMAADKAKEGTQVPAKPTTKTEDKLMTPAEQRAEIARQVAKATGVSNPNAANPAPTGQGGATIADMNKIVGDPKLGAQEKARRIAALTPAAS